MILFQKKTSKTITLFESLKKKKIIFINIFYFDSNIIHISITFYNFFLKIHLYNKIYINIFN